MFGRSSWGAKKDTAWAFDDGVQGLPFLGSLLEGSSVPWRKAGFSLFGPLCRLETRSEGNRPGVFRPPCGLILRFGNFEPGRFGAEGRVPIL